MASVDKPVKVDQAQIDEWKKKYRDIWEITIDDPAKELEAKTGYFRKPSRVELAAALKSGRKDDIRMAEVLTKNIFLGGDPELLTNDDYFFGVVDKIEPIVEAAQGTIKKL